MPEILRIIVLLLNIYVFIMIARVVIDLIQVFSRDWQPRGFLLVIAEFVFTVTDPPLRAIRKVIPPLRLGGIALDLGFIILFLGIQFLASFLTLTAARMAG